MGDSKPVLNANRMRQLHSELRGRPAHLYMGEGACGAPVKRGGDFGSLTPITGIAAVTPPHTAAHYSSSMSTICQHDAESSTNT